MHNAPMRSHKDIISAIGHAHLSDLTGASIHTARSWEQRDSLPAKYWRAVIDAGYCTADELIAAAAKRAA